MFWNTLTIDTLISDENANVWLRSANSSNEHYVYSVTRVDGGLFGSQVSGRFAVRPAFQIDLSKIEWQ